MANELEIYEHTVQPSSFTENIEYLLTTVGPLITAAGIGLDDCRPLAPFRKGEIPFDSLLRNRVDFMVEVTRIIKNVYTNAMAAAFFRSSQPSLNDNAPLMLIRKSQDVNKIKVDITYAARVFIGEIATPY